MNTFPTCLPTDIVLTIFNLIDQADCVECLCTCRHWYSDIPGYATKVWEQLNISPSSWARYSDVLLQCLGPHVKKVTIDRLNACNVLYKLRSRNCSRVVTLEIKDHLHYNVVENHIYGSIEDIKFLNSIERFSATLNELCIVDHPTHISATDLIRRFPQLTHLSLLYHNKTVHLCREENQASNSNNINNNDVMIAINSKRDIMKSLSNKDGNDSNKNMIYLHLNILQCCNFKKYLIPALRQCPKLKCLLVAGSNKDHSTIQRALINDDSDDATQQIELDFISKLCPNLEHVMWSAHEVYFCKKQQEPNISTEWRRRTSTTVTTYNNNNNNNSSHYTTTVSDNREKRNSIQGLIVRGHISDINTIMLSSIFTKAQQTLSYLELFNLEVDRSRDWNVISSTATAASSLLSATPINSLNSSGTNNIVIPLFPQHLETLKLTNLEIPQEDGWIRLFSQCQKLKHLDLCLGPVDMRWDYIVRGITLSLKYLQHLRLHDNDYRVAPHLDFGDCIRMLSQECKSLRCLEIYNIRISNQNFIGLCEIQSLQELALQIGSLEKASLVEFVERLSSEDDDATTMVRVRRRTTAALVTLKLIATHNLDDTILETFAHIKSLTSLSVLKNNRITDAGIKAFLQHNIRSDTYSDKCTSYAKNDKDGRKRLSVDQCSSVSRWGVWTSEDC